MIFRCDDISINTNITKLNWMIDKILESHPESTIYGGVSLLVHDTGNERVFPSIMNAFSDHRVFFKPDKIGMPENVHPSVQLVSHGLIHVDHRLLTKELQEFSIIVSCSIVKTNVYIPPFNKWNKDTESICKEHSIKLIKFEDGWKHLKYNKIGQPNNMYYFHTHEFTTEEFSGLFKTA